VTPEQVEKLRAEWRARHEQVIAAGGLHIIGTERHESRRIDNQLRGRSGRQGDPGFSRFYLSLEDNLMRIFASDRVKNIMQALGMQKGEAIEHRMVNNAIEKAQRKVESRNFDIRKQLLEYDDVANEQRQIIYHQRDELLIAEDISAMLNDIRRDVVAGIIDASIPPNSMEEQWDIAELEARLAAEFTVQLPVQQWLDEEKTLDEAGLRERIITAVDEAYRTKIAPFGADMRRLEKQIMLQVLDNLWKEHLATMDHLRQGIHLRSYAQKNPKQEYKREAFRLFEDLLNNLKYEVIRFLSHVEIRRQDEAEELERQRREAEARQKIQFQHAEASAFGEEAEEGVDADNPSATPFVREAPKVGRNDPCPCGSGKKYKQCHGALS
jgi:preprotein translocase subunit SecA